MTAKITMPTRNPKPEGTESAPRHKKRKGPPMTAPRPPRHAELIDHHLIFHEINNGDNRTAAVVGGSLVENNLALAIMARLRTLSAMQQKDLFDNESSPLGTFHRKIEMGFALSLYEEPVRADLHKIRFIRNQFAHHLYVRNFDNSAISSSCDKLTAVEYLRWAEMIEDDNVWSRREKYANTCAHLAARFFLESRRKDRPGLSLLLTYDTAWVASSWVSRVR